MSKSKSVFATAGDHCEFQFSRRNFSRLYYISPRCVTVNALRDLVALIGEVSPIRKFQRVRSPHFDTPVDAPRPYLSVRFLPPKITFLWPFKRGFWRREGSARCPK